MSGGSRSRCQRLRGFARSDYRIPAPNLTSRASSHFKSCAANVRALVQVQQRRLGVALGSTMRSRAACLPVKAFRFRTAGFPNTSRPLLCTPRRVTDHLGVIHRAYEMPARMVRGVKCEYRCISSPKKGRRTDSVISRLGLISGCPLQLS